MKKYLKLKTVIVLLVIAVFGFATFPLTQRDFYSTFKESVPAEKQPQAEELIKNAQKLQQDGVEQYPSVALLVAADNNNANLKEITDFKQVHDNSEVIGEIRRLASSSIRLGLDLNGGVEYVLDLKPDFSVLASGGVTREAAEKRLKENFNQYRDLAMEALRKRLEAQNIFESEITPFGPSGLSLKAPIVSKDEKDKLQKLIQMSNKLEFRLVHPQSNELLYGRNQSKQVLPYDYVVMSEAGRRDNAASPSYLVSRRVEMDGRGIEKAFVAYGQYGQIMIALEFNADGAKKFYDVTKNNVNRQLAIVLDGKLYCAPQINDAISGGRAEITGKFSSEEAKLIADALTSGSFPFKINVEAVYDTAPTLGADNVQNGIRAGIIALVLLATFMITYYRWAGVIAVTALTVNLILILGAMAAFGATLTMPGIAGIILTLGMAVDANVLVFERMREETENGKSAANVVELGFQKAYSSVIDGNLTTLVVAIILMYFGTGAIKGFAISLSIGIVFSLFTALFMSHVIFDWVIHFKSNVKFTMLKFFSKPNFDFMKQSKVAIPISLALILLSIGTICYKGESMMNVEFTGGTLLSCRYNQNVPISDLERELAQAGYNSRVTYKSNPAAKVDNKKVEILIRQGSSEAKRTSGLELQQGVTSLLNKLYPQLQLSDGQVTSVGGMVGAEMTKNAFLSILLSFLGMIVYVSLRYEFNYAAAGILALLHDVIIALGISVLLGREMSLVVVAALLTIVGYSINDTIVIFDRIREERHLFPERDFAEIVNDSLNRTLSRTILTSLSTLIVVVVMFFFGGIAINDFIMVIMIGLIVGCYSSVYIAAPIIVAYNKFKGSAGSKAPAKSMAITQ